MDFMHPDWGLFLIKYGHLIVITGRSHVQLVSDRLLFVFKVTKLT